MWEALFSLTNMVALAAWIVLLVLPRKPLPLSLVLYLGVGLLCLAYAAMFAVLFGGLADPVRDTGAPLPSLMNYTVDGLQYFFRSDGGLVLGWTHYLAFDLFVGLWIARDADSKGFGRGVQAPVLLLTYFAGPIGLLVWLIVRERRARASGWTGVRKTPAG
jgi:uncharacterized protein YhhL (DUF1145 family)